MDSHQWRDQGQSDQFRHQPSAKLPKLHHVDQQHQSSSPSALALFAAERNRSSDKATISTTSLSALSSPAPTPFPRVGGYFSLAQWQELELQALIYKYILAGASVPLELILPIKRSLLNVSPNHLYQHFQPSVLQTGYWGRCAIDPEPGRCRRTDGKKWRCSREVVTGQKYCERHVHRGRNRSRKHVEIPTPTASGGSKTSVPSPLPASKETQLTPPSGVAPTLNMLPLNQRAPEGEKLDDGFQQSRCHDFPSKELEGTRSDGHVLRRFFDDWPRSEQESDNVTNNDATHLSISVPENSPSDFSLKLATGNADKPGPASDRDNGDGQMQPPPGNWSGWSNHAEAAPMGGPLAEALRSSSSTPSPTSVLHKPHGSICETSGIST